MNAVSSSSGAGSSLRSRKELLNEEEELIWGRTISGPSGRSVNKMLGRKWASEDRWLVGAS